MGSVALALNLTNLSYHYPDGTPALQGLSLQLGAGERLALLGPNGAGKSTLLLHLNGLLRGSGQGEVLGHDLATANLRALRREVGLVFQSPDDQLLMPSVFDEVALAVRNTGASKPEVAAAVGRALQAVDISDLADRHPLHLSLGQKKRVALASVLVTETQLLLLDEPTAGLDPAARRGLITLLQGLAPAMVVATHDFDLALALCPLAAVMGEGQIIAQGPTEALLTDARQLRRWGL
jgi:cobalt/nickel transport system ATP-binding protein